MYVRIANFGWLLAAWLQVQAEASGEPASHRAQARVV
jgi:hypothetical protein